MQVAKITLWDGRTFFTDDHNPDTMRNFFTKVRDSLSEPLPAGAMNQVDLIEMTPEEYRAIPATVESARFFGK